MPKTTDIACSHSAPASNRSQLHCSSSNVRPWGFDVLCTFSVLLWFGEPRGNHAPESQIDRLWRLGGQNGSFSGTEIGTCTLGRGVSALACDFLGAFSRAR